jgi:3alpha(or 20beta)-hydroxysteroid dehydrogenase
VLDNQGHALAVELGPAASLVRHDVTSEADWAQAVEAAQKLGGLHGLVNNVGIYQPAADGDRRRALAAAHPDQPVRLLPRCEGGRAGNGALGRRVHREHLIRRRPQGLARVLRLCRDQMGAAGHDQVGSDRHRKIRVNSVHPGPIDTDMIAFRTPEQREER